jgi:hypothetical protein
VRIRLAIRGYAGKVLKFEELCSVSDRELEAVLPALAEKHAKQLVEHELHMIEIEFLDEPDINERFFRFGTDPSGMVIPIQVDLRSAR